ncbi:MAG: P1 family peptidase [Clostridiales bacterium]|jgi:L-aminopeptidase/D-esterase-like protein|nr:P1 family peptidase [Clostridiales bacterium]
MTDILLPDGITAGHAGDGATGVTVILCPDGAVGGVDVRGCAPGTRETDLLRPEKAIGSVNAIALCGGSAYGLGACDGVMRYLRERGKGHKIGPLVVPLVAGAVIYDLSAGEYNFPTAETGYAACLNAKSAGVEWGSVGAGTGASFGKIGAPGTASKGGVAAATVELDGVFVTAITVLNALGDVRDPDTGLQAGGRGAKNGGGHSAKNLILSGAFLRAAGASAGAARPGGNTTLSCVVTNAGLGKLQANKLASVCHDAFARCIVPVHTDYDGDTVFALSKGDREFDFTTLSVMAVSAVEKSILRAAAPGTGVKPL